MDTLTKGKTEEAKNIQQNKQELLAIWQTITTIQTTPTYRKIEKAQKTITHSKQEAA